MIKYPAQIDDGISLPEVNQSTGLRPEVFNKLRDAIIRVEGELGVKPSAVFGTVRARLDYIQDIMSNSLVSISGDLGGNVTDVKVIGINGNPIQDTLLTNGQVLTWDGYSQYWVAKFVPADTLLPPFTVFMQPAVNTLVEVNSTVSNPSFTAEYTVLSSELESVLISDSEGNPQKDVTSTPDAFTYDQSYTKTSFGEYVTITAHATNVGFIERTSSVTFTWAQKVYWGISTIPGAYNSGFITGLSNNELTLNLARTFQLDDSGAGKYIYFACRQSYGTPNFKINGVPGGMSQVGSNINVNGENYSVFKSDSANLGQVEIVIS
jgi:hypothetical protein